MRDEVDYQITPFIFDAIFKQDKGTTKAMVWILFPGIYLLFFQRSLFFSLIVAIGKLICLYIATINKTIPRCMRIKVQEDLVVKLPNFVELQVDRNNGATGG